MTDSRSYPGSEHTCYIERSRVRQILIASDDGIEGSEALLREVDALPIRTAEDFRHPAQGQRDCDSITGSADDQELFALPDWPQVLLECRDFIADLIGHAAFEGRTLEHASGLIADADIILGSAVSSTHEAAQRQPDHDERRLKADYQMGWWMAAALEDPKVCAEMKAVINEWFEAHQPGLDLHASTIGACSVPSTPSDTPPDWKQDQAETSRMKPKSTEVK